MVLKKPQSVGLWSVESNGETKQSISKDTKPVIKKSIKRKSAQIGAGNGEAGDDTRKSVVNATPAKKAKEEQQLEASKGNDSPIKAPVTKKSKKKSKKRKSAQIGAGDGEAGDDTRKSVVNASPAKKAKKEQQLEASKGNDSPIKAPVTKKSRKKSKKRKSAQIGAGNGEAGDDTSKSVVNATPAKKVKEEQQLEASKGNDSPIKAPVTKKSKKKSKKRKSSQIGAGNGEAGDDTSKSVVNASPAKESKKEQQLKDSKDNDSPIKEKEKGTKFLKEKKKLKKAIARAGNAAPTVTAPAVSAPEVKKNRGLMNRLTRPRVDMTQEALEIWIKRISNYLKTWKENRMEWRFGTRIQESMVRNMLDDTRMPDDIFPLFLEYIAGGSPKVLDHVYQLATEAIDNLATDAPDSTAVVRARLIKDIKPTNKDSN